MLQAIPSPNDVTHASLLANLSNADQSPSQPINSAETNPVSQAVLLDDEQQHQELGELYLPVF